MKAKIYRFIFSILLVCFAAVGKAQTIDGKLYTPFNNYYQWIGGKFNSNLNIPKITATTGRDTGGIRYNLADSSVYVWTGSQWQKVGGSSLTFSNGLTKTGDNVKLGGNMTDAQTILNFGTSRTLLFDSIRQFAVGNGNTNNQHLNVGQFTTDIGYGDVVNGSFIELNQDSILLKPFQGKINIDTLATTSDTSTHKPIVYDVSTGRMKYKTAWQNTDTATVVKAYVTNAEAVTITKGQVVYIFGASGDRAAVKLAKNTSDTFSSKTLGIVRADIAAGQAGWVTTQGQVSGINLGAYTAGDILWLDSVPGGFTNVKPVAPYHGVFVGVVERANAGNGLIYVKPQNGVEIDEIHDILITNKKIGDGIVYTGSLFENKQVNLKQDTVPLAVFNVGSAAAGDTAAFSTSTLAGSFYLDGTDTMFVTSYRVALQGTSASITPEVWFNDSLNVTAGGTKLVNSPSAITNLTTGTSVTPDTNKIPPGNFVFVRFSAVTTKPTYFTLTLFGYRIRKQ